jgi:large-conductance mechanosensitive channel
MAQYVHFGIFLITVLNFIVIILVLVTFALAVALSLPQGHTEPADQLSNQVAAQREESAM